MMNSDRGGVGQCWTRDNCSFLKRRLYVIITTSVTLNLDPSIIKNLNNFFRYAFYWLFREVFLKHDMKLTERSLFQINQVLQVALASSNLCLKRKHKLVQCGSTWKHQSGLNRQILVSINCDVSPNEGQFRLE